ncbi:MAG: hypothetical protein COW01_15560 [Bdellovibrionales bacterium CG12_big_fil_rev_8_21_14_0_65_38_15]|nr:MAG: hypothetical protein COW79_14725 [Bdellovibrionales bacterium CG22_combo_CG10-13_8_21_14_all_38_13]PIQ52388.1 MAG: hypothetical protein COW01_15560 [Bdellovibrionales bacterium CG12_big_fil_rev_8_21_14_0_65_38_15]PIR29427.1 MAG: hypothetical protein COV38_10100 [Bdellovibrionales bacterium CG11_big_fil_rev_8_21_14_0_20_38_13]
MKTKKNAIRYGKVEVDEDLMLEPKIRTTIFLEESMRDNLKQEAVKRGMNYQQLLREIVRDYFDQNNDQDLKKRLDRLEKRVFGA